MSILKTIDDFEKRKVEFNIRVFITVRGQETAIAETNNCFSMHFGEPIHSFGMCSRNIIDENMVSNCKDFIVIQALPVKKAIAGKITR